MRPVTVAPSRIAAGGSVNPTFTSNVRVTGSACGATSRTRPRAVTAGSSVRLTLTCGSRGAERSTWPGTSNTASRPPFGRATRMITLPGLHHFAGLGAPVAVTTPAASAVSFGVAHPILGRLQLRLRDIDLSAARFCGSARALLELRARGVARPARRVC